MLASFGHHGDGEVSASELRLCCMRAASGEDASAVVASAASKDGDALLDEEGELAGQAGAAGEEEDDDDERRWLREVFGMYKMDGAGCITPLSLKLVLARLSAHQDIAECQAIICRFDLDGDGVLNFDEFKAMMKA